MVNREYLWTVTRPNNPQSERQSHQMNFSLSYIDTLMSNSGGLTENEKALAREGQKIAAVKELRSRTGFSLKESKDLIDFYNKRPSLLEPRKKFKDEIDKILEF